MHYWRLTILPQIRLFGDPGNKPPSIEIDFAVELEYESQTPITHAPQFDVVPDILDGHPFGSALAIGLRGGDHDCELLTIQVFDSVRAHCFAGECLC